MLDIEHIPNFLSKEKTEIIFANLFENINWQNELLVSGTTDKKKINRKILLFCL